MVGAKSARIDTEIAIAGGGMAGLSLALALSRAGVPVTVIEQADKEGLTARAADGRASAIAAGSQRILAALGVWGALEGSAGPIREIRVSDGDSPLFLHYCFDEVGAGPLGYIVENGAIRSALVGAAERSPSLEIRWGRTVAGLDRDPAAATLRLDDGSRLRARLLVAADGRDSPLREAAGIGAMSWRYPQTGIVCTVSHERPHRGIAHERFLPSGPFAILPMTGNRSSIVWTEREALAPALLALDETRFNAELSRRFGDFLGALTVMGRRYAYPLSLSHADRYAVPRVALVGDAAHGIHPIAGQGLNLGIRDIAVLAETVVDGIRLGLDCGDPAVLAPYERRRRPDNLAMIAVTDGLNRLFSNDVGALRAVRTLGLAAVNGVPPLKRLFMRHAMGASGDQPRLARGLPL